MRLEEYQKANPDYTFTKLNFQWQDRDVYQAVDARPKGGMNFSGSPSFFLVREDGEAEWVKAMEDLFGIMRTIREQKGNA